ncbi:MAG: tRNA uridine-5-carboxymethylaminomethyl(34) synthesis GTPase MnmE [Candidatus Coatesbacteria bacterium]|nr:tRNA uridine-5-carboxymethylaminomethyl(34) synthesis GTPase MnmE [Candidatus Coatesbacteria bacterium]
MNSNLVNINDSICAIATTLGYSAISIIRLCGNETFDLLKLFFCPSFPKRLEKTKGFSIHSGLIVDANIVIDDVIVAVYRKPHSYTGEDMAEIFCHGGLTVPAQILHICTKHGFRMASEGEFTRRAFINGKMNLMQVEAISDILTSTNSNVSKTAVNNLSKDKHKKLQDIFADINEVVIQGEVNLDFSEDEQIEMKELDIVAYIEYLDLIVKHSEDYIPVKNGLNILIAGPPNSGKSSLFNTILNQDRSIVSHVPGTTRDYISEKIILHEKEITIVDTAGYDLTGDEITREGMKKAEELLSNANAIIYLIAPCDLQDISCHEKKVAEWKHVFKVPVFAVLNKTDLLEKSVTNNDLLKISVKEGTGIKDLLTEIDKWMSDTFPEDYTIPLALNQRQLNLFKKIRTSLIEAKNTRNISIELYIENLRHALSFFEELFGIKVLQEILDEIFSRFCIGK